MIKSNIVFAHLGPERPDLLDPLHPVVYEGTTLLGRRRPNAITSKLPAGFLPSLEKIQGKIGRIKGNNFHIYAADANQADGINRICYIVPRADFLLISEYGGARGANYSGLYPILRSHLQSNHFQEEADCFKVGKENLELFVAIINQIVENKLNARYVLEASSEQDSIFIVDKRYYYFKAYWSEEARELQIQAPVPADKCAQITDELTKIERIIYDTVTLGLECKNIEELEAANAKISEIHSLLNQCSDFLSSYANALQKAKQFSSQADEHKGAPANGKRTVKHN